MSDAAKFATGVVATALALCGIVAVLGGVVALYKSWPILGAAANVALLFAAAFALRLLWGPSDE